MQIRIRELSPGQKQNPREVLAKPLGFGRYFADRMFRAVWNEEQGWHDAEIGAYERIALEPASLVFHYAQEIFEGLKAYRLADGGIGMFRPDMNAKRFNASAERLVMPTVPVADQLEAQDRLVKELEDWIPEQEGYSLYIRPTMIATNAALGVRPGAEYLWFVICSPVAGYFERGFEPVRVTTSRHYVRAAVGGLGAAKAGANYAASLKAAKDAKAQGFDQVVWLDATEHRFIEEMGGMNISFVYGDTIATCPLTGSILPGVTRDSILALASGLNLKTEERLLDVEDVCAHIDQGKITEVFACGTAAVVTPVALVNHAGRDHTVGDGQPGPVSKLLYKTLTDIQYGRVYDSHGWTHRVG